MWNEFSDDGAGDVRAPGRGVLKRDRRQMQLAIEWISVARQFYLLNLEVPPVGLASRCLFGCGGGGRSCCLLLPATPVTPDLPMRGTPRRAVGPIPRTAPSSAIDEITAPPAVSSLKAKE